VQRAHENRISDLSDQTERVAYTTAEVLDDTHVLQVLADALGFPFEVLGVALALVALGLMFPMTAV
jgi:hypothetical protein